MLVLPDQNPKKCRGALRTMPYRNSRGRLFQWSIRLVEPKARDAASWKRGRKAWILVLSSRPRWTRFVSKTTIWPESRSSQKEVPVKPRWPTLWGEK